MEFALIGIFILVIIVCVILVFRNPFSKATSLFATLPAVLAILFRYLHQQFFVGTNSLNQWVLLVLPFIFVGVTIILVFKIQLSHNRY
ncbi:MAG TPA: hypothetical protein IAA78_10155 [Candidatus Avamphibacillus intestinigallinarum]|nr:hypothetical protein [Candidatus Avamphibacillus intestinigallinarum]